MSENTQDQELTEFPVAEPRNGAREQEYLAYKASIESADDEKDQIGSNPSGCFPETGGTIENFEIASKQVAQILKKI